MGSVDDAIYWIGMTSAANGGRPIDVIIVDHGAPAYIGMGQGDKDPPEQGKYIQYLDGNSAWDMLTFAEACRTARVDDLWFLQCEVAAVDTTRTPNVDGAEFLQKLANLSRATVTGYDAATTISGAHGFFKADLPEPVIKWPE
jgi:hypothetical protein